MYGVVVVCCALINVRFFNTSLHGTISLLELDIRQSNWYFATPLTLPWFGRLRRSSEFSLVLNVRPKREKPVSRFGSKIL